MKAHQALICMLSCASTILHIVGRPLSSMVLDAGHSLTEAAQAGSDTSKAATVMEDGKLGHSGVKAEGEWEATNSIKEVKDFKSVEDDGGLATWKDAGSNGKPTDNKLENRKQSGEHLSKVVGETLAAQNEEVREIADQWHVPQHIPGPPGNTEQTMRYRKLPGSEDEWAHEVARQANQPKKLSFTGQLTKLSNYFKKPPPVKTREERWEELWNEAVGRRHWVINRQALVKILDAEFPTNR